MHGASARLGGKGAQTGGHCSLFQGRVLIDQLCSASLLPAITIGSFCLLYCLSSFKPDSPILEVRRQAHRDEQPGDVDNVQDPSGLLNTKYTEYSHLSQVYLLVFWWPGWRGGSHDQCGLRSSL